MRVWEIFEDAEGKLSSKRVFGGLGFLTVLVMGVLGASFEHFSTLLIVCATMLGVDSITGIFKK